MHEVKILEVRDSMTTIPVVAIRLHGEPDGDQPEWLIARAGFASAEDDPKGCVLFGRLDGGEFKYDPHQWGTSARTIPFAHKFVYDNWDAVKSGDVVDVQYIFNETKTAKQSERGFTTVKDDRPGFSGVR